MSNFLEKNRHVIIAIVLVALISFAIGVAIDDVTTPATGSTPIYSGSTTWSASAVASAGSGLTFDGNTVCFVDGASSCDNNIDWNGTDIIINAS
jgi:hypothetical protein